MGMGCAGVMMRGRVSVWGCAGVMMWDSMG